MTIRQAMDDLHAAMEQTNNRLQYIATLPAEQRNFRNTFLAYTEAAENLNQVQCYIEHLVNTRETPALLQLRSKAAQEYGKFKQELRCLPRLLQVIRETETALNKENSLSEEQRRVIRSVMQDLKLAGAHLSPKQLARKNNIEREIQFLTYQFQANLTNPPPPWEHLISDPARLTGMPPSWMQRAEAAARDKGLSTPEKPAWLINLTSAHADEVLYHCSIQETRKLAWLGINRAGTAHAADNESIIYRIMELRHEQAQILGYRHYADMKTSNRMMGSGAHALAFVNDLLQRSKPAWDAWVSERLAHFSHAAGQLLNSLAPWDEKYILSHQKHPLRHQAKGHRFDDKELMPYLEMDNTLNGLLRLCSNLLGVTYTERPTCCLSPGQPCPPEAVEVWAPDVRCFEVRDTQSGVHLGSFFLDIYPQTGKRTDISYCFPLRIANPGEPTLAVMVSNFPPKIPGKPQLLTHLHLRMLFHEFGHLMHMCLAEPKLRPLAAMSIEADFIELPSILMENLVWEPTALATFARHYQTGETIPQNLLLQLSRTRTSNSLEDHIRSLCLAKLDLELHMHYHEKFKERSLDEVTAELLHPWLFPGTENIPSPFRTLTHCIGAGYDAAFYTYKWSEMLAEDALCRFREEGLLTPDIWTHYRRTILTPGATESAQQLFQNFMGREPSFYPLLRRFQKNNEPTRQTKSPVQNMP